MSEPLKYPEHYAEFPQAELAALNGMDKAAVYIPMKEAQERGIIERTGTRPQSSGRGKPSNLYRVASNNVPVPVPATLIPPTYVETYPVSLVPQSIVEVTLIPLTPPAVNSEPNPPCEVIIAKELDKALQEHRPPVVLSAPNSAYPCPLCDGPMTVTPDATGVMVKCFNPCDPQCHENPFGHGRTAKDAYDTAKQKFQKA